MAEGTSASSQSANALTLDDLDAILKRIAPAERELLRELVRSDNPRESMTLARIFHHFPTARIVSDDTR